MDDRLRRVIQYARGPTVLDFGAVQHDASSADSGDWLHGILADRFETVVGVDILPAEVQRLQAQGFDVRLGDVTDLNVNLTADTVVAGEIIEHVADAGGLIDSAARHLRPGGRLILTTPNPWAIVQLRRLLRGDLSINDEHVAWYGPQTLRQLCERRGFDVERVETTRRDHRGLMRLAQYFDHDHFAGTTWIVVADYQP